MAILFYVLGWLGLIIGGAWTGITLAAAGASISSSLQNPDAATLAALATTLIVAGPGLSVMSGGLLLLAIGAGLGRLDTLISLARRNGSAQAVSYGGDTRRWSARDRQRAAEAAAAQQAAAAAAWQPPPQ